MNAGRRPWKVMHNSESDDGAYCVDVFVRTNGTFGFEYFRRDVEDGGAWTPIGGFADRSFDSQQAAESAAKERVAWFRELLDGR